MESPKVGKPPDTQMDMLRAQQPQRQHEIRASRRECEMSGRYSRSPGQIIGSDLRATCAGEYLTIGTNIPTPISRLMARAAHHSGRAKTCMRTDGARRAAIRSEQCSSAKGTRRSRRYDSDDVELKAHRHPRAPEKREQQDAQGSRPMRSTLQRLLQKRDTNVNVHKDARQHARGSRK